jgi:hypothetical protein
VARTEPCRKFSGIGYLKKTGVPSLRIELSILAKAIRGVTWGCGLGLARHGVELQMTAPEPAQGWYERWVPPSRFGQECFGPA